MTVAIEPPFIEDEASLSTYQLVIQIGILAVFSFFGVMAGVALPYFRLVFEEMALDVPALSQVVIQCGSVAIIMTFMGLFIAGAWSRWSRACTFEI